MENMIILKTISIFVTFLGAVDSAVSVLPCENKFYSLETDSRTLIVYCNCDVIENSCEVANCDNEYENIHKLDTYGCSTKDILLLTNIFKTIPANQVSMTTLLTYSLHYDHTVRPGIDLLFLAGKIINNFDQNSNWNSIGERSALQILSICTCCLAKREDVLPTCRESSLLIRDVSRDH